LNAPVAAGKNYRITANIIYQSASTGVGIALGVVVPDGSLFARITIPTTATTQVDKFTILSAEKISSTGTPSANKNTLATITGIYCCAVTGTLSIKAASETTASVSVQGGSLLFFEEI
jgi:microcystin-dependent protein